MNARRRWLLGASLWLFRCGGPLHRAPTHIGRTERVPSSRDDEMDGFFTLTHALQVTLNEADHRRVLAVAKVAEALALSDEASPEVCAAELIRLGYEWQGLKVAATHRTRSPSPEGAAAPELAIPTLRECAEWTPVMITTPGQIPDSDQYAKIEGLQRALTALMAVRNQMFALIALQAPMRAWCGSLLGRAPGKPLADGTDLALELGDAQKFLAGIAVRARDQGELCEALVVRFEQSLSVASA